MDLSCGRTPDAPCAANSYIIHKTSNADPRPVSVRPYRVIDATISKETFGMKPAANPVVQAAEPPLADPPTLGQLFMGFFVLGMTAFGGALPLARRMMVEKHRWISGDEFTTLLGLCQFLPGGNIINLSVAIGMRFRGVTGAVTALMGFVLVPTIVVIMLGVVYEHYQHDPYVRHLFAGLAAAAAGLLISLALKIGAPLLKNAGGILVAALCFLAIAVLRLPLLPTMLVLTPISILLTWRARR
jgi:chromate transporter